MLVDRKVTGLPVVDGKGRVVGVVSDYDMLALEGVADAQVCTKPYSDDARPVLVPQVEPWMASSIPAQGRGAQHHAAHVVCKPA